MTVTREQMNAWNRWHRQAVLKKAQQKRTDAAVAVMKKPAPQQARLF